MKKDIKVGIFHNDFQSIELHGKKNDLISSIWDEIKKN